MSDTTNRTLDKSTYDRLTSEDSYACVNASVSNGYGHLNVRVVVHHDRYGYSSSDFSVVMSVQIGAGDPNASFLASMYESGDFTYAPTVQVETHESGGFDANRLMRAAKALQKAERAYDRAIAQRADVGVLTNMPNIERFGIYLRALGISTVLVEPNVQKYGNYNGSHHTQRHHYDASKKSDQRALSEKMGDLVRQMLEMTTPADVRADAQRISLERKLERESERAA